MSEKKRLIIILSGLICLVIVACAGFFYFKAKGNQEDDNIPPIVKEVIRLNEDVKKTTVNIYNASGQLESVSMVLSRVADMKKTIGLIQTMREHVKENQKAIDRLIEFTIEHETYFHRKNLAWLFGIRKFYTDYYVTQYYKSQNSYLTAFENLLTYTYTNYQNIMELRSQQHMKTYDVYYMRYRTAADSHNRFNRKRIKFYKEFIEENPEVSAFLPGGHHLESFKFWDKFSF